MHVTCHALVKGAVSFCHPASIEARPELFPDALLMQLQFIDLVEDFKEVLEKDVCLLAVQDVVIADDGPRLHAEL